MWLTRSEFGPAPHEPVWDEYQWEEFFARQDDCAAEYLALVEYFGDDVDSYNLICRAMGWQNFLSACREGPDPATCRLCAADRRGRCNYHAYSLARTAAHSPMPRRGQKVQNDGPADATDPAISLALDQVHWKLRYASHPVKKLACKFADRLFKLVEARQSASSPAAGEAGDSRAAGRANRSGIPAKADFLRRPLHGQDKRRPGWLFAPLPARRGYSPPESRLRRRIGGFRLARRLRRSRPPGRPGRPDAILNSPGGPRPAFRPDFATTTWAKGSETWSRPLRSKSQIPNSKSQTNSKHQIPKKNSPWLGADGLAISGL